MAGGRPRTYDRQQLALDLIEWAAKDDSVNMLAFCTQYNPPLSPVLITKWAREDSEFALSYEAAKAYLGHRREQLLSADRLHVKAYDLNATTYDHFLKDEKRQAAEHAASLAVDDKQKGTVLYVLNPTESAAYISGQVPTQALPKEHS